MKDIDVVREEMLQKKKWAVIGVTPDKNKFGYKIYNRLKEKGYTAYGVNSKYNEIDGEKIYASIKDIPESIDCVNIVVNPKTTLSILDDIKKQNINYVWFQLGTFDEEVLDKANKLNFDIVYYDCLYIELGRI